MHGFTAAPDEVRPLGERLAAAGFPVRAVRLPGHGTRIEDLARVRWTDWFAAVEDGMAALAADGRRVAVAGVSMGALLALHLAVGRPEVAALVLAGTALRLGDRRAHLAPLVLRVPPLARRFALLRKSGRRDISDPVTRGESFTYDATPLGALVELLRLQRVVRAELRHVTQPALLLHGREDHTIPLAWLDRLKRRLGSRWIETRVLERSWHVVTLDHDRDEVGRLVLDFLDRVEKAPA